MRRDQILTIASIFWLTGSAGSSAQFYYEAAAHLPITVSTVTASSFMQRMPCWTVWA